jgi:DNA-binding NarL/FixJ family response regulator
VLELMREGLRTAEIARRLGISAVTVRRHVSDLLCKLDVPDRKTAVGLVEERSPI